MDGYISHHNTFDNVGSDARVKLEVLTNQQAREKGAER
jgi:hypothetical protein